MQIHCEKCDHADTRFRVTDGAIVCKYCGHVKEKEKPIQRSICPKCGAEILLPVN